MLSCNSYQFIEDAYVYHKQHMESMTHQLQEKKKVIEDVSNSINNGYVVKSTHLLQWCILCLKDKEFDQKLRTPQNSWIIVKTLCLECHTCSIEVISYVCFQTSSSWREPFDCSDWNKKVNLQFDFRDKQEGEDVNESPWGMMIFIAITWHCKTYNTPALAHDAELHRAVWWRPLEHCSFAGWLFLPWGRGCIPSSC